MTLISLEGRLRKLEAARAAPDHAIKALSDEELADALRAASDDPRDHALARWFQAGAAGPLPPGALETLHGTI